MKEDLERAEYSPHTVRIYTGIAHRFAAEQAESIERVDRAALRHWASRVCKNPAAKGQVRKHFAAVRFLFAKTLGKPELVSFLIAPRRRSALPVVLSRSEVARLLEAVRSPKFRVLFAVLYGSGLRISEACELVSADIDAEQGVIRVRGGKGRVAREALLGVRLLRLLREYWRWERPVGPHLFQSRRLTPVHHGVARRALRQAAERAGLAKQVTPHVLRHTFATHLLEAGADLRVVQALLGHASVRSTARYVRVCPALARAVESPLDVLDVRL